VRPIFQVCVGLTLAGVLAAILVSWDFRLRGRIAALAAELHAREVRLAMLAQQRQEAEPARAALAGLLEKRDRLPEDRDATRWAAALRSVAVAAGADVELADIRSRGVRDDHGGSELRIEATGIGRDPRTTADRFRRELAAKIESHFGPDGATTRFERLEDDATLPSARPDRRSAKFTIMATTGAQQVERSAGR
jgi:hypothetical protein